MERSFHEAGGRAGSVEGAPEGIGGANGVCLSSEPAFSAARRGPLTQARRGEPLLTQQLRAETISLFLFNFAANLAMASDTFVDMAKLTKRDIVVAISNQTGMVQHEVFDVVQRTLDKITDSLANNVAVELRNFGVFQPRLTKPRVGRNPNQPGSSFVIPPRVTVKFKAGKIMRQRVEKLSRELKEASERQQNAASDSHNGE
jgi:nucleoid DNA-binding protein